MNYFFQEKSVNNKSQTKPGHQHLLLSATCGWTIFNAVKTAKVKNARKVKGHFCKTVSMARSKSQGDIQLLSNLKNTQLFLDVVLGRTQGVISIEEKKEGPIGFYTRTFIFFTQ